MQLHGFCDRHMHSGPAMDMLELHREAAGADALKRGSRRSSRSSLPATRRCARAGAGRPSARPSSRPRGSATWTRTLRCRRPTPRTWTWSSATASSARSTPSAWPLAWPCPARPGGQLAPHGPAARLPCTAGPATAEALSTPAPDLLPPRRLPPGLDEASIGAVKDWSSGQAGVHAHCAQVMRDHHLH